MSNISSMFAAGIEQVRRSWGWFLVSGIVLMVLGIACIGKAQTATTFSILTLGWVLVISGVFWLINSFQAWTWGGFFVYLLNAILRCVTGYLLIRHPDAGAEGVTMVLAALFIAGGLFRVVGASWQMYPVGVLFGLGFDTATEVGLLGVSAATAAQGLSIWSILVFPALFTAGMTLIDTIDSMLMLGAYGWAFIKPVRKLYYNMTITAASVVVAFVVGSLETLNLIGDQLGLTDGGGFWGAVGTLNDNFGALGYIIVGIFLAAWIVSFVVYRLKRYGEIEAIAP